MKTGEIDSWESLYLSLWGAPPTLGPACPLATLLEGSSFETLYPHVWTIRICAFCHDSFTFLDLRSKIQEVTRHTTLEAWAQAHKLHLLNTPSIHPRRHQTVSWCHSACCSILPWRAAVMWLLLKWRSVGSAQVFRLRSRENPSKRGWGVSSRSLYEGPFNSRVSCPCWMCKVEFSDRICVDQSRSKGPHSHPKIISGGLLDVLRVLLSSKTRHVAKKVQIAKNK